MTLLTHSENFLDISRQIVEKFIQSVVAVDDQMIFDTRPIIISDEEIIEPDASDLGVGEGISLNESEQKNLDDNKLYYQDLSSEFAEKAIICSGLKPYAEESKTVNAILKSSKNSDITILDWQMESDSDIGRIASNSIKEIIKYDIEHNGRLRLIVIYTAEKKNMVLERLERELAEYNPNVEVNDKITFGESKLKLCHICIISKLTSEKELSEQVIKLFTELTVGILSNTALASITEVRNQTHNILYKFNKNLDTAYLSHVLGLISSPDMREQAHEVAIDYAVDLISEEIKSELQTSIHIKKSLSKSTLKSWPDYINIENKDDIFSIKVGDKSPIKFGSRRMKELITVDSEENLEAILIQDPKFPKKSGKSYLEYFKENVIELSINDQDSSAEHLELSAIECLRRDKRSLVHGHLPVLKQGSILKFNDEYYICIQPLCDSVRLYQETSFIFLKVEKVDGVSFSHVIRHGQNEYKKLKLKNASKFINVIYFNPTDSRVIQAEKNNENYIFKCSKFQNEYEWCGEFKQAIYQEIVNSVYSNLSRVGLDSFEWLRLKKA
ncbi:response regulator receiver domain [Acinetobacter baumannii]|uniref:response regulator receiver domain n=1 Tax=Acinetobacter baumannii TaxID=470 RepID=UPI00186755D6|nr:response regulator receiver domain [Acinetobacter baumannii]MCY2773665.1 response regulator receiver domain [Acinetobacter baumannii]MCY2775370.1 response regulator receiver domain [Acinetobacter baumannii]MCY2798307.1 response regulator receiver domain [Acinetobacter baumannii]MCY2805764.1 response regulator receiver domain [Acinetobacter baumannii]MCY2885627.1 response regulator receiver domain [Acinetobacter baumannii]